MKTAIVRWCGVSRGQKTGRKLNTARSVAAKKPNKNADSLNLNRMSMEHPFAKQPTAMEVENLIYEVAVNRVLILVLLQELEKHLPGITESVQELLNAEPQRVYGLVSQFVEEPSPYYAPLLQARQDYHNASKAAEALKALLNVPKPPNQGAA